jgi:hypothetical protein
MRLLAFTMGSRARVGADSAPEGSPFCLVCHAFDLLAYLLLAFALPPRFPFPALPQHLTQTHVFNVTTAVAQRLGRECGLLLAGELHMAVVGLDSKRIRLTADENS